jgi:hypothetical protein
MVAMLTIVAEAKDVVSHQIRANWMVSLVIIASDWPLHSTKYGAGQKADAGWGEPDFIIVQILY